ncbi:MAG: SAM-dependent methyltransferase [Bacteroidetes bacterium]|nr:MAG: SAM-dependent methyltransferase [Bacteroidota bacterium]
MPHADSGIFLTQDGSHSIYSAEFGVPYHSKYGAIQESMHVFLQAGLHYRLPSLSKVRILEMGFGTGLNALLTYRVGVQTNKPIEYTAVEAFPISMAAASALNYPQLLEESAVTFAALHRAAWNSMVKIGPYFSLLKQQAKLQEATLSSPYDVIYYDAFAPTTQPELWTEDIFAKLYAATAPQGVLVTYCAKGAVKRALKAVGYQVEGLAGPPGKREMTRATRTA